jgi:hypothetical protein
MKKIGYDFDGVLHKNVTTPDGLGERHHMNNIPLRIYYDIIQQIMGHIANNNEVYIISRGEGMRVRKNIDDIFKKIYSADLRKDYIKDENIYTDLYEKNISKSKIIEDLNIDEFYDDSIFNIHDINRQIKKGRMNTKIILVNPDKEEQKEINKNNLKILSYNVNWKHMLGREEGEIKECKKKDLCSTNINKLILNELPLDFIFLQEFENKKVLLKDINKDFQIIKSISEREYMVMCVNLKYDIDKTISGEFEPGRPFLVVLLKEKICLINVHMPHNDDYKGNLKKIEDKIRSKKINLDNYRIIIGGDFNQDIGLNLTFLGKKMYNTKKEYTCCLYSTHMYKNKNILKYKKGKNIDHILDSQESPIYTITLTPLDENNNLIPGSDHLGLYTELNNEQIK